MLLTALLTVAALSASEPIELYRQWKADEKFEYSVSTRLQIETRTYMSPVYMPEINKMAYKFTLEVKEVTDEGFASVDYKKPNIVVTVPETAEKQSYDEIEEVNEHLILSISPVNAIIDYKDLTPKKDDDGDGDGTYSLALALPGRSKALQIQATGAIGNMISEFYGLANFTSSVDTMLDFAPRLSLFEVEPGDTWEHTVSYQPQPLEGKEDKMAPQRIDYTMTYVGVQEVDGRKIHRVTSDLSFETDIAPFLNSMLGMTSQKSGLRGFKMSMTAHIDFDLDFETKHTISAIATSQGYVAIELTTVEREPAQEIKVTGRSVLKLVSEAGS